MYSTLLFSPHILIFSSRSMILVDLVSALLITIPPAYILPF